MAAATDLPIDEFDIISPDTFAERTPHEEWKRLRRESPIHRFENTPLPFWAITKHADITSIGRQPDLFLSGERIFVNPRIDEEREFDPPPTLIQMDNPQHRLNRKLISSRFTPRALKKIYPDVDRIARKIVDDMLAEGEGEIDFVDQVAAPLPIAVIAWLLGVPESDWQLLYDWTNALIGFDDPDFNPADQDNPGMKAMIELYTYFGKLVEERKRDPQDDLITLFAHAEIEGKPLDVMEVLSWCQIIVVAGNETTRNATSKGMLALIEHPEQLQKMKDDPSLLKSGVEEILRWTSPLTHFARTTSQDVEFNGHHFAKGDTVALYYPSANRDEDVFEDPEVFDVTRKPNRHIAFGVGEHFCAGAHVARLELEMAYKYLLPRLDEIELAGEPERLRSNLISGLKTLPIRFKARA